jgi:hypothetical protein
LLNRGQDLLGEADMAFAPHIVNVAVKIATRREMLTRRSKLLNILGQGYARAIR